MANELKKRVDAIFNYLEEVVRLGLKVFRKVEDHEDGFILFQNELPDDPGISIFTTSGKDLFWLSVRRQNIPDPPELPETLEDLVKVFNDSDSPPEIIKQNFSENDARFNDFSEYLEKWEQWAEEARVKKKVQALYDRLFKVKEKLKYDEQLELIWGYGILLWKNDRHSIKYPLVIQRMVVDHQAKEGVIHLYPEDEAEPKLELDILKDTGLPDLSDIRKQFVEALQSEVNDIDNKNFQHPLNFCLPILKDLAGRLSPEGEFVEISKVQELKPTYKLQVVNCWVIFLRKRQQDAIIRDIQTFKSKLKNGEDEPTGAILSFIRDPEDKPLQWDVKKQFDEWKVILDKQVLFPLPANEEQVQILDCIEQSNGIVVWGPPGTGKSHTIANLISHFMAEGKRVLVTSQKDQALSVLHDMLPPDLRPLCISVLSNVRDSREKLERAVSTITEIVTQSQPKLLHKKAKDLESKLDRLREELITIVRKIKELSIAQFRYIKFEEENLLPSEVVEKMKKEEERHMWFEDSPDYKVEIVNSDGKEIVRIVPIQQISQQEIKELKKLRTHLLNYLSDLAYDLPCVDNLIDEKEFQKMAEDLKKVSEIKSRVKEHLPDVIFKNEDAKVIDEAIDILERTLSTYKLITESWQCFLLAKLREKTLESSTIYDAIESLNTDAEKLKKLCQARDPLQSIKLAEDVNLEEQKSYVEQALSRLREGKKPYKFFEFNKKKKQTLNSIIINGKPPTTENEWQEVLKFLNLLISTNELKQKWNNFAQIIYAPQIDENKASVQDANKLLELIEKLNAPLTYVKVWFPKAVEILNSIIIEDDRVVSDDKLEDVYKALKLKKDINSFQSSKALLERLKNHLQSVILKGNPHPVVKELMKCLEDVNNQSNIDRWIKGYLFVKKLETLKVNYKQFKALIEKFSLQAPKWAWKWKRPYISEEELCPPHWQRSWWFHALKKYIDDILNQTKSLSSLEEQQSRLIKNIRQTKENLVLTKVKISLIENLTETQLRALKSWHLAVRKLGKGKGKYTWQKERLVRQEMKKAKDAVPVWIMPLYKVSETIPSDFGIFDVVIVDESSQCDIRALLALARGRKVIIVGDPEQISPDAVGINREEVSRLINIHLNDIPHKEHFYLETSLYDISDIVFSGQGKLMLKEHFRCVPEIIEFSNRLCYDGKILPLRNPPSNKRLEPVLESVFVEGGYREGRLNINKPEARAICEKVQEIVSDPRYKGKSIGIISLLGNDQARYIFNIIDEYITPEQQEAIKLRVGDSYAFQGDERDIIVLSMVVGSHDERRLTTLSHDDKRYRQRFNVAVSRARDKIILFHSVKLEDLKPEDLRYQLLNYIQNRTFVSIESTPRYIKEKFESPFEEEVYNWLISKGFRVTPQVRVGHYRIDLVVEGDNSRLAIECDGGKWHPPERWWQDQIRQRQLERMGWEICRIWGSDFYRDPNEAMKPILLKLDKLGIAPKY